ncbi:MAG TPA: hypothetical protein VF405_07790, partial [Gammaproteobacteria bacterium]
ELTWPHELEAPVSADQQPAEIEQAADDSVPVGPLSDYLSISEHPLFTYDRRPFVMVVAAAPVPVGPRVEFELTAVVITRDTRIALLRSNLTPTVRRVALNQSIDGWTLAEVTPDSVVLRQSEVTVTVPLRPDLGGARSGHAARIDPASGGN